MKNYEVVITGFKSRLAAEVFARWYECSGEQCIGEVWNDMEDAEHGLKPYCNKLIQTDDGYRLKLETDSKGVTA